MTKTRLFVNLTLTAACLAAVPLAGAATIPRTWVGAASGNDSNAYTFNGCTRYTPCASIGTALLVTSPEGEVDVMESGPYSEFSNVVVTQSVTIDGGGSLAGITSLLNGSAITVNAGPNAVVILRNLTLNGVFKAGLGSWGIRIISAKEVYIDNVNIENFNTAGIWDERTTGGKLVINNVSIRSSITGISLAPTGTTLQTSIDKTLTQGNTTGLSISGPAITLIKDSTFTANGTGIHAGSGSTSGISKCTVSLNSVGMALAGGSILSYGNNEFIGNVSGNSASGSLTLQ